MRHVVLAAALASLVAPAGCQSNDADDVLIGQYSLSWGPVAVQPGQESTQCIWLRLSNDTEIKVHQMHNLLSASSHHLIVYKDDLDQTEQPTPVPCQPFTSALNTIGKIFPIMITQKRDELLTLPQGVAYTLAPQQMIKIEMHYLNATDAEVQATATADLFAAEPAGIHDEANFLFIGTPDISLAPNAMAEVHEFFNPSRASLDLDTAKFFAITGHTHKLGLSVEIGTEGFAHQHDDPARRAGHVLVERTGDDDPQACVPGPDRGRLRLHLPLLQLHERDGPVRRVDQRRDVLLLGVLLPVQRVARLRPHDLPRPRPRPVLPGRRPVAVRSHHLGKF